MIEINPRNGNKYLVENVNIKRNVWSCFYCICMHIKLVEIQFGMLATNEIVWSCIAFVLLMNIINILLEATHEGLHL
jgi:hypothetical protein